MQYSMSNYNKLPIVNKLSHLSTYSLLSWFIIIVTFFSNTSAFAQYDIPKKPSLQTSVYDYINLLSPSQKNSLEHKLIKYSDSTSTQIVVAVISSTKGEYINYLGTNWAHKWGIGDKDKDNGIFILLAKDDRKIDISTGYGVEHLMTDAMSKRIIERDIIPYFKQGDYYGGLNKGVNSIFEVMTGEYQGSKQPSSDGFPAGVIFSLFIIFIIILISISKNRRGGGGSGGRHYRNDTSRSILETIILSNAGRSSSGGGFGGGFGGGSSGGGGFGGGFGGGGFGGGGASGGW